MANQQIPFIEPVTGAVTSNWFPTNQYTHIVVTADALAGAETVNIQVLVGSTATQVLLSDLTTPATLTSSLLGLVLDGGPTYRFVKSATASACGLYIDAVQR